VTWDWLGAHCDGDPLWRVVAYWLVIGSFFSLPMVVLIIHLTVLFEHADVNTYRGQFAYIWNFHKILAGLLAAMLGLNSWDKRVVKESK